MMLKLAPTTSFQVKFYGHVSPEKVSLAQHPVLPPAWLSLGKRSFLFVALMPMRLVLGGSWRSISEKPENDDPEEKRLILFPLDRGKNDSCWFP